MDNPVVCLDAFLERVKVLDPVREYKPTRRPDESVKDRVRRIRVTIKMLEDRGYPVDYKQAYGPNWDLYFNLVADDLKEGGWL